MKPFKTVAVILSFVLLFSLSSCKGESDNVSTSEPVSSEAENTLAGEVLTEEAVLTEDTVSEQETVTENPFVTEAVTEASTEAVIEVTTEEVTQAVTEEVTEAVTDSVSSWSTEEIVSFYKTAATDTGNSVKSEQVIALSDISVNNGELGGVFKYVTPILSKFLSGNTTVTDGITGEFELLAASDIVSAAAQKNEKGTVIELTLKEQTDKGGASSENGSVAHGISVVGDLLGVMAQLKDVGLPIEISVDKTVIRYTDPRVQVLVGSDGKIVSGTWSCTVEISLTDYTFAGAKVDSTSVVLENTITVNGGFNP